MKSLNKSEKNSWFAAPKTDLVREPQNEDYTRLRKVVKFIVFSTDKRG